MVPKKRGNTDDIACLRLVPLCCHDRNHSTSAPRDAQPWFEPCARRSPVHTILQGAGESAMTSVPHQLGKCVALQRCPGLRAICKEKKIVLLHEIG